jgi:Sec-independent protein translocase protein TatA
MKWLIILVLLAILVMFFVTRYRRHIQTGIYMFKMFRKMRQMNKPDTTEKQIENTTNPNDVQLVRCTKCGSWIPQYTAMKLSKNTFYCSSNCMEKSVEVRN